MQLSRRIQSIQLGLQQIAQLFFFLMIRRPPRSTQSRSSAASDVYKRQTIYNPIKQPLSTFDGVIALNSFQRAVKWVNYFSSVSENKISCTQCQTCLLYTSPSPRDS
eukprot:TRINITY_DN3260_c0_g1_i12.p2 TRINITY_DN3260_c0_g1~~TRINITY_DN3260_c0_g1_i12.p2  ORF type:complete len:107 (-),score=40.58 TRINITY_DN3260_c0_g1_i12:53-373(-)